MLKCALFPLMGIVNPVNTHEINIFNFQLCHHYLQSNYTKKLNIELLVTLDNYVVFLFYFLHSIRIMSTNKNQQNQ